jgi:hypothetical protein
MTATRFQSPQALARDDVDEMLRSRDSLTHMEESISAMNLTQHEHEALSLYAQSRRTITPPQGWSADR